MGVDVLLSRFLLSWHRVRASQAAPAVADVGPRRKGAEDMGGNGAGFGGWKTALYQDVNRGYRHLGIFHDFPVFLQCEHITFVSSAKSNENN